MQLLNLKIYHYRNYVDAELHFSPHKNIIVGKNGSGKTNLIEAIYVLGITKSFRTIIEKNLILKNMNEFSLIGEVKSNKINKFQLIVDQNGKTAKINNKKLHKLSDYISNINIIALCPDDLKIIKQSPSIRRKYLNIEISQINNKYLKYLNDYNKILKQRNSYLKTLYLNHIASYDYLDILTERLILAGEKIYKFRKEYIKNINKYIDEKYWNITKLQKLEIKYVSDYSKFKYDKIFSIYKKSLKKDLMFGQTTFGIHHDDFEFLLNNENMKEFGSEGQQKATIIALKLSEMELFKEKKNEYPILILDDLFSELDNEKIKNIMKLIPKCIQLFITTTSINNINSQPKDSKTFKVTNGKVGEI